MNKHILSNQLKNNIYIYIWVRGEGVPHSHSEAGGARLHYRHLQIHGFLYGISIFFVQFFAFFENRSSRQLVSVKSFLSILIMFFVHVLHLHHQWIPVWVAASFCAQRFLIFTEAYSDADFGKKLQTAKSMDTSRGIVFFLRTIFFNFHGGL